QNPIEQEGTYPLPEAQMDRFLMHVSVGYPQADAEAQIIRLARAEEDDGATANGPVDGAGARLSPEVVFAARQAIHRVTVSEPVERYIVTLVQATRDAGRFDDDLKRWIQVGVSPRGSIGLDKVARAIAWLRGRDHVTPEDVQAVVHDVFRHRLILSYEAHAAAVAADAVIDRLLERVAVA
ncbi:MAG: MoxR family ATPase, partial [Cupriavidus sp.]|nr:MoxR family ATPase [Cupriavidus sp.]